MTEDKKTTIEQILQEPPPSARFDSVRAGLKGLSHKSGGINAHENALDALSEIIGEADKRRDTHVQALGSKKHGGIVTTGKFLGEVLDLDRKNIKLSPNGNVVISVKKQDFSQQDAKDIMDTLANNFGVVAIPVVDRNTNTISGIEISEQNIETVRMNRDQPIMTQNTKTLER